MKDLVRKILNISSIIGIALACVSLAFCGFTLTIIDDIAVGILFPSAVIIYIISRLAISFKPKFDIDLVEQNEYWKGLVISVSIFASYLSLVVYLMSTTTASYPLAILVGASCFILGLFSFIKKAD